MNNMEIKEKNYKIKATLRSYIFFEIITQKTFELTTTMDRVIYLYCVLIANNEIDLSFDEFMGWLDEDNTLMARMFAELNKGKEGEEEKKKEVASE